jgi:hypothetical protein
MTWEVAKRMLETCAENADRNVCAMRKEEAVSANYKVPPEIEGMAVAIGGPQAWPCCGYWPCVACGNCEGP